MQGLAVAEAEHGSRGRRVDQATGHRGRRVQLRSTERRAGRDVGRVVPGDRRRRLQDVNHDIHGGGVVVRRIRRREVHMQDLAVAGV